MSGGTGIFATGNDPFDATARTRAAERFLAAEAQRKVDDFFPMVLRYDVVWVGNEGAGTDRGLTEEEARAGVLRLLRNDRVLKSSIRVEARLISAWASSPAAD